ncbi:hypothetical protein GCM10007094_24350 [Pseudovibrio japonicus]|uniref:Bacteriophage N4 adsorption protein A C-terminal domain-containing protein n=1 Tax=Pseudovibrio japonicus TaxID=366534 RepID=A0ABQ3EDI6_9HYPH|nr:tetratricopeptide repeat protein [Pseudovibrio japonicus]GHB34348.1 hypothetical protein GCM10007094_24350 [Pseudovibrio japonicus]
MTRSPKPHRERRKAKRRSTFYITCIITLVLVLTFPTQLLAPETVPTPQGTGPYTTTQKNAYYNSLLKDRQDSQSVLQSTLRDYRTYPLLDLAYRLLAEGRTEEALEELDELLEHHPEHLVARWQKIQLLIGLNRPLAAIEQLAILQSQAPAFSRGYLTLGQLHMLSGDYTLAFDDFRLALETGKLLPSDRAEALAGAAEAAIKLDKNQEALNALNGLLELGAATPRQRLIRADLLRNFNQLDEARSEWEALSKLDNAPQTQRTAILNEAFLLIEQGEDAQAYDLLLDAERNGLFTGRQSTALEQRTFARALAASALNSGHLEELLTFLNPSRIDQLGLASRVQLAYALAKKGSSAEAEQALLTSDGKILDTKAFAPEEAANYYLALTDIALRAGDEARAATAARLLNNLTRSPEYALQLSQLAQSHGWENGAINTLLELRDMTEQQDRETAADAWADLLLALSELARRAGDLTLADEALREAAQLVPSWRTTALRGRIALLANDNGDASALFQQALIDAKEARANKPFNDNETEAYARLLFDLASVSAANQDWNTALKYLIDDWMLDPDPTLVLPAYLMLKEEDTPDDQAAHQWLENVFDYVDSTDLTDDDKDMFAVAFLALARVQKSAGDLQDADKSYTQSMQLDPEPDAILETAYLSLQLSNPERALSLVDTLDQPQYADATMAIRCQAHLMLRRSLDGLSCSEADIQSQPTAAEEHLILGNLYLQRGDNERAKQELMESYKLSPSLEISNQLGFIYQRQGDNQGARRWFSNSFEKYNDQTAGMALLYMDLEQMNYDGAASILARLQVARLTSEQMARYYAARAQITLRQGDQSPEALASALADLIKARSINSTPDVRFSVVQILFQMGQLEEAEAEYENLPLADKINPAVLALGGYIALAEGDYDLAIIRFEASLEIDPNQEDLQEDLAYTYLAAFENRKAARIFRQRIEVLHERTLDIYEQDKLERFQRQLRILDIPISLLIFDGISPSRQDEEVITGAILGIPSSSPFGSIEAAWRPPVIGFQNGRVFEVIARAQWLNRRYSFIPNDDTYQTIVGVRFKPLMTQNLKIGVERFFKGGTLTEDNTLGRILWSYTRGHDFLPLYDWRTGLPIEKEPYVNLYLEGARFFENEKAILAYGDGRLGYTFRLDHNLIFSPFVYSIGSGNWSSLLSAVAIEAGLGASLRWRGVYTETYGDLLRLEVFARVGHEVLNTDDSQTSRVLLGLQANF